MDKIYLSPSELSLLLGISKVTLWRIQKNDPSFPKCHRISAKKRIWRTVDVENWIKKVGSDMAPDGSI